MSLDRRRAVTVFLLGVSALTGVLVSSHCPSHAWQTQAPAKAGEPKAGANNPQIIRDLIVQIGDDSFEVREAAHKRLAAIGGDAFELLHEAALNSTDAEVRKRAGQLARSIEKTLLGEVRCFERHVRGVVFPFPWVTRVVVTSDGRKAVSAGCDGLRSWDLVTGKQVLFFGQIKQGAYWSLALSPDGRQVIAGGSDKIVRLFDLQTGKQVQQFIGHKGEVWGAAMSPDGKRAVTGAWDQLLCVWDVETGKQIVAFEGVRDNVRCLALSADGQLLAAGHMAKADVPGTVRLWDVPRAKEVRAFVGHTLEVSSVAFSPDGKRLLTSSFDKTVRLWDVARGEEVKRFVGHTSRVEYAAFTPDGKRIVSCGDQDNPTIRLWDVASGKQLFESESVDAGFLAVAVLPDGRQCVTAGKDGVVRLWRWVR